MSNASRKLISITSLPGGIGQYFEYTSISSGSVGGVTGFAIDENDDIYTQTGRDTLKHDLNGNITWQVYDSGTGISRGYQGLSDMTGGASGRFLLGLTHRLTTYQYFGNIISRLKSTGLSAQSTNWEYSNFGHGTAKNAFINGGTTYCMYTTHWSSRYPAMKKVQIGTANYFSDGAWFDSTVSGSTPNYYSGTQRFWADGTHHVYMGEKSSNVGGVQLARFPATWSTPTATATWSQANSDQDVTMCDDGTDIYILAQDGKIIACSPDFATVHWEGYYSTDTGTLWNDPRAVAICCDQTGNLYVFLHPGNSISGSYDRGWMCRIDPTNGAVTDEFFFVHASGLTTYFPAFACTQNSQGSFSNDYFAMGFRGAGLMVLEDNFSSSQLAGSAGDLTVTKTNNISFTSAGSGFAAGNISNNSPGAGILNTFGPGNSTTARYNVNDEGRF